ncbi:MAG TPA: helix-turn-helix transcriptional regulator [Thermoanaerobaculia bacterium]|jgi:transcriptional regulator with XRE-family HTH domain|nr:helix-turn-helix transcriptional regulator [Thermoanaerobaculia bacterium]
MVTRTAKVSPLKLARILRAITQDELVARVRRAGRSTDRGEVSRIERGLQPLTDRKARDFARALRVKAVELKPDYKAPRARLRGKAAP